MVAFIRHQVSRVLSFGESAVVWRPFFRPVKFLDAFDPFADSELLGLSHVLTDDFWDLFFHAQFVAGCSLANGVLEDREFRM